MATDEDYRGGEGVCGERRRGREWVVGEEGGADEVCEPGGCEVDVGDVLEGGEEVRGRARRGGGEAGVRDEDGVVGLEEHIYQPPNVGMLYRRKAMDATNIVELPPGTEQVLQPLCQIGAVLVFDA